MKTKKIMAASLASVLLVSGMAIPTSAKSSYTPTKENFSALFDFDSIPTAKYTVGYEPGVRSDLIGDSKTLKCISADGIQYTYDLAIVGTGGIKGKALKLTVNSVAPPDGIYCPLGFYPMYGEHKNPTLPNGYHATALTYWMDNTGFKDTDAVKANAIPSKGNIVYIQEKDYDTSGKQVKKPTAWDLKSYNDNGYWLYEDGNGNWSKGHMNDGGDNGKKSHDFYVPNTYKGWIRIPFETMELMHEGDWAGQVDQDNKIDALSVEQISLGSGNYQRQIGSTIIYDEFGFVIEKNSSTTKTPNGTASTSDKTTAAIAAGTDTTTLDTTDVTDTTEALDTTAAVTAAKQTTTIVAQQTDNNNTKSPAGLIIAIIAIVVVLGGAGTGLFFFDKKVKKDGYSSIIDYFKNRKNTTQQ